MIEGCIGFMVQGFGFGIEGSGLNTTACVVPRMICNLALRLIRLAASRFCFVSASMLLTHAWNRRIPVASRGLRESRRFLRPRYLQS